MPFSETIKNAVRTIPDWPQKGIMFRDITPLFQNARVLRSTLDQFVHRYMEEEIDLIAGIDARGFLLGVTLAYELKRGFIPVRKKGKLPFETISEEYELEFGRATVELHRDAVSPGQKVIIMDDLIATGGTMLAAIKLIRKLGGEVREVCAIIDLPDLGGSEKIRAAGVNVYSACSFDGH